MARDLRLRFEASPGHSSVILFSNQQVITIQQENQTLRSVPLWVGRSVREPPQDGSEYEATRLIELPLLTFSGCLAKFSVVGRTRWRSRLAPVAREGVHVLLWESQQPSRGREIRRRAFWHSQ